MSEEAAVTLSAKDDITAAVNSSIASLKGLQSAATEAAGDFNLLAAASSKAGDGISLAGAVSQASVIPHRAAHQALNLVTMQMSQLAGASGMAAGPLHVVDSILFSMAMTGGAISLTFVAVTAAVVGMTSAITYFVKSGRDASEAYDKLLADVKALGPATDAAAQATLRLAKTTLTQLEAQLAIEKLTPTMGSKVSAAWTGIEDATKKAASAAYNASLAFVQPQRAMESLASATVSGITKIESSVNTANPAISSLQKKIDELGKAFTAGLASVSGFNAGLRDLGTTTIKSEWAESEAEEIDKVMKALGRYSASMAQVQAMATAMHVSTTEAAHIMVAQTKIIEQGFVSLASTMGASIGNAMMGIEGGWQKMAANMVGMIFDVATAVVIAAATMNKALTLSWIPGTFIGILALVGALQLSKALVVGALNNAASKAANGGISAGVGGGNSSGTDATTAGTTGVGGTAVSSASQVVNNYNNITLPVEALDLSAVSDAQMRSLANRIARLISQGASGGQFSLVGA